MLGIRSKRFGLALLALTLPVSTAFAASPRLIDVPKGTVGKVAFALGRQAGINIAIRDPSILGRPAPALRGRMTGDAALARLAAAAGLRVKAVGSGSYILVAAEPHAAPARRPSSQEPAAAEVLEPQAEPEQLIVVTASKRDTIAPRFAGQWTQIDGKELVGWGVVGTEAIEARSVGFSSTHLGSGRNKLFIRGIADSSFSGPTQSPVGQYVGDMRLGYNGPDPDIRLVDIQSVEVLEGPQGTLYGSGSLGGIVLLKPVAPKRGETAGKVSIGVSATRHGDPGYDASGIVNAPLWDGAAIRAVGYHSVDGGYVDNLATGEHDINRLTTDGGRATLSVDIAPGWSVDASGIGQRIHGDDSQYTDRDSRLARRSEVDQPFTSRFAMGSVAIRKDDGPIRARSTTGFTRQRVNENFDASIGDRVRQLGQQSRARSISNETRVWRPMADGYSWLAGFSSIVHHYDVSREVREDGTEIDLAGVDNRVRETTVYGEVGVKLLEGLEASAGARYTISDLSGIGRHLNPLAAAARGGDSAERKERRLLPSFALLARPIDRLTLYGRYQQGFRPGGLSIESDFVRAYRNDRLATIEAGVRYGTPERDPFDLQGSVTRSKWYDIQADFIDAGGLPSTDNIGDGRVWTVTLNGGAQLSDALRLEAGVAWNDGKITRPSENFLLLMADAKQGGGEMRIPNIARVAARGAIDWSHDIGGGQSLKASGYVRYVGKSRLGVGPRLGDAQGDYLDSGLSIRIGDERRAWSLTVTNLADQVGNRFAFGAPLSGERDQITPLRPQTFRLGFEAAF